MKYFGSNYVLIILSHHFHLFYSGLYIFFDNLEHFGSIFFDKGLAYTSNRKELFRSSRKGVGDLNQWPLRKDTVRRQSEGGCFLITPLPQCFENFRMQNVAVFACGNVTAFSNSLAFFILPACGNMSATLS